MPHIGIYLNANKILINRYKSNYRLNRVSINNLANHVQLIKISRNILGYKKNYKIEPLRILRAQQILT